MFVSMHSRAVWLAVLAAVWWTASCLTAGTEPSEGFGQGTTPGTAEDPKREKIVKKFVRQLARLRPLGTNKKKAPDDFFLIGTAELNPATRHADVRFDVKQGQQEVAEFLVDYILDASKSSLRKWQVFSRLKDAQQAEQALQLVRSQYDRLASYRKSIAKAYSAKTVRRT